MTQALFRDEPYLQSCSAKIIAIEDNTIELDQTVFYAEGGGQPGDRGSLSNAAGASVNVLDTRKGDGDSILHICADPVSTLNIGDEVTASIDWPYRYKHMRTHTCLHLLCSLIDFPVTGGSISQDKGRLDFDMAEGIDKAALEQSLQALINADHPVGMRWISDAEMHEKPDLVRTMSVAPPSGQGQVRLVDIESVDLQACGGTHVKRTIEIGNVRIGKVEKKGKRNRRVNLHLD